jgi:hypothetical protein
MTKKVWQNVTEKVCIKKNATEKKCGKKCDKKKCVKIRQKIQKKA